MLNFVMKNCFGEVLFTKSKLIVMLTCNDRTFKDARKVFYECYDLPIEYWGFKNTGISEDEMCKLIADMHKAGKKTFFETITYTRKSCLDSARFACEHKFDYLLGTLYFPSVWNYIKTQTIKYYPFIGNVSGIPSVLSGSVDSILTEIDGFYENKIHGVDLLAYRHSSENPIQFAQNIIANSKLNIIVAGNIDSIERIKAISLLNPWGFTIGGALYTQNFISGAGYRANLEKVIEIMEGNS